MRILVVEDEQDLNRILAKTLTAEGYSVDACFDGVEALDYLEETGLETIRSHEQALARQFYEGVSAIPGVTVYGDFTTWDRAPVVSLNIRDYDSSQVSDVLAEQFSIATRPGAHCAPRLHRALGTMAQGAVRFSFGWFNTEEETQAAIAAVRSVAE